MEIELIEFFYGELIELELKSGVNVDFILKNGVKSYS